VFGLQLLLLIIMVLRLIDAEQVSFSGSIIENLALGRTICPCCIKSRSILTAKAVQSAVIFVNPPVRVFFHFIFKQEQGTYVRFKFM